MGHSIALIGIIKFHGTWGHTGFLCAWNVGRCLGEGRVARVIQVARALQRCLGNLDWRAIIVSLKCEKCVGGC